MRSSEAALVGDWWGGKDSWILCIWLADVTTNMAAALYSIGFEHEECYLTARRWLGCIYSHLFLRFILHVERSL